MKTNEATASPSPALLVLDRQSQEGGRRYVETRIRLPSVTFQQPLLRVDTEYPRSTPAGQAFRAEFAVSNLTPQLQQLTLVVGDASGFVIAGKTSIPTKATQLFAVTTK